jgi:hypothetical protein
MAETGLNPVRGAIFREGSRRRVFNSPRGATIRHGAQPFAHIDVTYTCRVGTLAVEHQELRNT